jgi:hypothetical protein
MEPIKPLHHYDAEHTDDETLRRDLREHVARWGSLQLVAELLTQLRAAHLPWWSPSFTRGAWRPLVRMQWLAERADVRQRITSALTGLPRNAARSRSPELQAGLIEAVLDHGDVTEAAFEEAFTPIELVAYGPGAEIWAAFRDRMPWEDDAPEHQKLVGWLLRALTTERCILDSEMGRKPILTAAEVRCAIGARTWQERLPLEVRTAIDEARMKQERTRPREPFQARHELAIVTPELLAQYVPLAELAVVFDAAEKAMAFDALPVPRESGAFELSPQSKSELPAARVGAA